MLFPKKVKHRKWHKMRKSPAKMARPDTRGISISFGAYGLKSEEGGRLKSNQLEAARKAMSRALGKTGRYWFRVFPDRPVTAKPAEVGMGGGKGDLQAYSVEVRPGRVIFEVDGVTQAIAKEALRKAGTKLPVKTKVVSREIA